MATKTHLSLTQKILLAEDMWDSLTDKVECVTLNDEKDYVESRLSDIRTKKEKLHSWNSIKAEARRLKTKIGH